MIRCERLAPYLCAAILALSFLVATVESKQKTGCPPPDWHSSQNWQGCATDTECLSLERVYLREDGYSLTCIKE